MSKKVRIAQPKVVNSLKFTSEAREFNLTFENILAGFVTAILSSTRQTGLHYIQTNQGGKQSSSGSKEAENNYFGHYILYSLKLA